MTHLQTLLNDALAFRTRSGTPALSHDDGATLVDPRGRRVPVDEDVWTEVDEVPHTVWESLSDLQREPVLQFIQGIVRDRKVDEELAEFLKGVRTTDTEVEKANPLGISLYRGEER